MINLKRRLGRSFVVLPLLWLSCYLHREINLHWIMKSNRLSKYMNFLWSAITKYTSIMGVAGGFIFSNMMSPTVTHMPPLLECFPNFWGPSLSFLRTLLGLPGAFWGFGGSSLGLFVLIYMFLPFTASIMCSWIFKYVSLWYHVHMECQLMARTFMCKFDFEYQPHTYPYHRRPQTPYHHSTLNGN